MNAASKIPWLVPTQWKPGQSGNPAGKAKGTRHKIEETFLRDLLADWDANGAETLIAAREKDPVGYVKVVASLMPKKVDPDSGLEDISRDELRLAINALQSFVAARGATEDGKDAGEPGTAA